jgi:hypothetical protein
MSRATKCIQIGVIISSFTVIILTICTILLWILGYYKQIENEKLYIKNPVNCTMINSIIKEEICNNYCDVAITRSQNPGCPTLEYKCWVPYIQYIFTDTITNKSYTTWHYIGTYEYISSATNVINNYKKVNCWYNTQDPTKEILYVKPHPLSFYTVSIIFACLTGAAIIIMIMFIVLSYKISDTL